MRSSVELSASVTEAQADALQQRLSMLPFKTEYQEEQHGPLLVALIACTPAQEKLIRDVLQEVGASIADKGDAEGA